MSKATVTSGPEPAPAGRYLATFLGETIKEGVAKDGKPYAFRLWRWAADAPDGRTLEIEIGTSLNVSTGSKAYPILSALAGMDVPPGTEVDFDSFIGAKGWLTIGLVPKQNSTGKRNEFVTFERAPDGVPF